jgi:hypothetical protein
MSSDVLGRAGLKSPGLGRALPSLGLSESKAQPAEWAWAGPGLGLGLGPGLVEGKALRGQDLLKSQ